MDYILTAAVIFAILPAALVMVCGKSWVRWTLLSLLAVPLLMIFYTDRNDAATTLNIKYIFFIGALLALLPGSIILLCERAWIRWAMLGLFLPLLIFNYSAINFISRETYRGTARGLEISLVYIVAAAMLLTMSILKGYRNPFPEWGTRLYALYFISGVISLQNSVMMGYSAFELWKMVMIYLVYLAIYYYLEFSRGDFDIILYGIAIVVIVNFVAIVIQHQQGIYQVPGLFPHQNSLAMYMTLAGTLFFARSFNRVEGRYSIFFFITFLMASGILVRTYSRGALACYPIGCLVTLISSMRFHCSLRKLIIVLFLGILCTIGLVIMMPRIIERFENAPKASAQTRKNLAVAALNMIKDVPLAGVGINNWGVRINPPYTYSEHRDMMRYDDEHQDGIVETIYLLVAAECGIPGLLMLLAWFGYYWIVSFRLLKPLRDTPFFFLPAGTLGGLTGVYLQSALEWVLKQQINYMLLVTLFAALSYLNKHCREYLQQQQEENEGNEEEEEEEEEEEDEEEEEEEEEEEDEEEEEEEEEDEEGSLDPNFPELV